jgi:hypothetical protein
MGLRRAVAVVVAMALGVGQALAADQPEDAAQAVAESWLKLTDAGDYAASWGAAAMIFKMSVRQTDWVQNLVRERAPLGKLVSRRLRSREYTERPEAPDGAYVVIQFDTVFEKKEAAVETVVPMVDPDGRWRVSSYSVR